MKPFLKWVGGKSRSIEEILAVAPTGIATYYEPFFGGGALFWELAAQGRIERACLSDTNLELIRTLTALRSDVGWVIEELERMTRKPLTEERYYALRRTRPRLPARRAARMIVLNKCGYKGLYRVNRKGGFNVPWGDYKNPKVYNAGHLRECSALLQKATLIHDSWEWAFAAAGPRDFIYCDPPYQVATGQSGFHAYTRSGFTDADHAKLAKYCGWASERGTAWAVSNADNSKVTFNYSQVPTTGIRELTVVRSVNGKPREGTVAKELLIWFRPDQVAPFGAESVVTVG